MKVAGPKSPATSYSHGIRTGEGCPGDTQQRDRIDPDLEIDEAIWNDETVRGLLEDWLIPAIVDRVIGDLLHSGGDAVR